jgi:hypothetical protein
MTGAYSCALDRLVSWRRLIGPPAYKKVLSRSGGLTAAFTGPEQHAGRRALGHRSDPRYASCQNSLRSTTLPDIGVFDSLGQT